MLNAKATQGFASYLGKSSNPDAPIMSEFRELALHSHGLYLGLLNAIFTIIMSINCHQLRGLIFGPSQNSMLQTPQDNGYTKL